MASSLIRKIEADFLACAICFEPLYDPIGLPCLHGYCFECLDNWFNTSQDKKQVICPACKVAATVPVGGIRGFPGHFLVKNLQETIDMEKQVKQKPQRTELKVGDRVCMKSTVRPKYGWGTSVTHASIGTITVITGLSCYIDFPKWRDCQGELDEMELVEAVEHCGICKKRAMVYCLDCKVNLCKGCCDSHKTFPFMKDHKIATIVDIRSGKVTLDEGRLCTLHGEVVRYYCLTDLKQVCPDCVSLKTCPIEHDRVSMKEAATKQVNSIKEMVSTCGKIVVKYQNAIKETDNIKKDLTKAQSEAIAALEKVKKDCQNQIDKLVKDHTEKISQVMEDRGKELQSTLDELKKSSTEIQAICDKGSHLAKSESEFEITHKYADMARSLQDIAKAQPSILRAEKGLSYLKFEAVAPVISSVGELHTSYMKRKPLKPFHVLVS